MVHLLIMLCEIKKINYFLENKFHCSLCLQSQTSNFICEKPLGSSKVKFDDGPWPYIAFILRCLDCSYSPHSIKPFYKIIVIKEGLRFAFKHVFKEGRVFIVIRPLFCSRKQCATQSLTCRLARLLATSIRAKTRGWRGGSRIGPLKTWHRQQFSIDLQKV